MPESRVRSVSVGDTARTRYRDDPRPLPACDAANLSPVLQHPFHVRDVRVIGRDRGLRAFVR